MFYLNLHTLPTKLFYLFYVAISINCEEVKLTKYCTLFYQKCAKTNQKFVYP